MTVYSSAGDTETVATYAAAGVDRVVVWLPPADAGSVLAALDAHRARLADVLDG